MVITAKVTDSKDELIKYFDEGEPVIIGVGQLYSDLKELAQKSQRSKLLKKGGIVAIVSGLIVIPGGLAYLALGGGLVSYFAGKNTDSMKNYKVEIDEVKKELIFYREKGKNKYKKGDIIQRPSN